MKDERWAEVCGVVLCVVCASQGWRETRTWRETVVAMAVEDKKAKVR